MVGVPGNGMWVEGVTISQMVTLDQKPSLHSLTTAVSKILDADPMRVAIIFSENNSASSNLYINGNDTNQGGIVLSASPSIVMIDDSHFPGLAAQEWWCAISTGTGYIRTVETLVIGG